MAVADDAGYAGAMALVLGAAIRAVCADPDHPTEQERAAVIAYLKELADALGRETP